MVGFLNHKPDSGQRVQSHLALVEKRKWAMVLSKYTPVSRNTSLKPLATWFGGAHELI